MDEVILEKGLFKGDENFYVIGLNDNLGLFVDEVEDIDLLYIGSKTVKSQCVPLMV